MQTLFNKVQHVLRHFTNLKNERSVVQEGELNADEMEEFSEEVSRENEVLQAVSANLRNCVWLLMHALLRVLDSETCYSAPDKHFRSVLPTNQ